MAMRRSDDRRKAKSTDLNRDVEKVIHIFLPRARPNFLSRTAPVRPNPPQPTCVSLPSASFSARCCSHWPLSRRAPTHRSFSRRLASRAETRFVSLTRIFDPDQHEAHVFFFKLYTFYVCPFSQVLVFIHGASLPGAQYTTLFTQLQQASPLNLWVVLPGFLLDTPNPLEIKVCALRLSHARTCFSACQISTHNRVNFDEFPRFPPPPLAAQSSTEAALKTAQSQGLSASAPIFFGGHSLGAVMVANFVANMTEWAPKGMMITGGFLSRYATGLHCFIDFALFVSNRSSIHHTLIFGS